MQTEMHNLEKTAYEIRKEILKMTNSANSGHPGGSMSCIDILTCLYSKVLRHDPRNPDWEERDFFVLSKGHASPALYGILAYQGYFPKEELMTFRKLGSKLQGHPERIMLKGVEITTGSLGQGLSVANGIALGLKLSKSERRVYCLLGDGELQEGQVWEALLSSGHRKLDNLCVILDRNKLQIDGKVEDIKSEEPIEEKVKAFKYNVLKIDGHNYTEILNAFENLPTDKIIILPNNKNIILAAQNAASVTVKKLEVIPSRSVPQG
ncbi:MAG: thiamine pyrophosphate-dependent enzyme, partial [Acidobacteria bacterium]|nr:thiamine pyrophosphate-dependent enzyme [Acidobacteriota bacterium]